MNKLIFAAAVALSCVAGAADAKKPADAEKQALAARLKELDEVLKANSMGYGNWNDYYLRYYCPNEAGRKEMCTEQEREEIKEKHLAACAERVKLVPDNARFALDYAKALSFAGRHADSLPHFEKAVAGLRAEKRIDAKTLAFGLLAQADAQFAAGQREASLATLRETVKGNWHFGRGGDPSGTASTALACLAGDLLDYDHLPRHTGAKAYPDAQKADYSETFAPLTSVDVTTDGMDGDDPRFAIFDRKMKRFGIEVSHVGRLASWLLPSAPYRLHVAVVPDEPAFADLKPFQRREAYRFESRADGGEIRAATKQGVLWGLVTFLQMIDQERNAIRLGTVLDWPDTAERGFLDGSWPGNYEYAVMNKMNNVDSQGHCCWGNNYTPLNRHCLETLTKLFVDSGLTIYYGIYDLTMGPTLPLCQPRTLEIQAERCRYFAKMGAGVYYPYDDGRYPLNPMDKEKYGIGRNCDADHIAKLYRTVAKDYPDFKLIFCPPFYWGPDSDADGYGEDREEYLKSLRKIPQEVELYWTGPMVKSFDKTRRQVKWFTDLTGHKPAIFQNGMNPHRYLVNMGIDSFDFAGWHYPEFYEDIALFHANSAMPLDSLRNTTVAQGLWNAKTFVPARAAKRGAQMMLGEKSYDILIPGVEAMSYFDKYGKGSNPVDVLNEKPDHLAGLIATTEKCWAEWEAYVKTLKYAPKGGLGHYMWLVPSAKRTLEMAKNPPDFLSKFKEDIEKVVEAAKTEAGYDPKKGDILLTPANVNGGGFFVYAARDPATRRCGATTAFKNVIPKRLVRCLRGAGVKQSNSLSFQFECDPFPPTGSYTMYVNGMDDERPEGNVLAVAVNGKEVGRKDFGFPQNTGYSLQSMELPFAALKRNNTVTISNVTPGSNPNGTPWLMVNYIVLKKFQPKGSRAEAGVRDDGAAAVGELVDVPPLVTDREETVRYFSEHVYGRRPDLSGFRRTARVVESVDVPALDAVRKTIELNTMTPKGEVKFQAFAFFPRKAKKAPTFVYMAFRDPRLSIDRTKKDLNPRWPVEAILARGYATVAFWYEEVAKDKADYFKGMERPRDGWGTISTWALASSRVMDWLETEPMCDTEKVCVIGLSRLGKTAIWAGVTDPRFAMTVSNESGCGGARLQHIRLPKAETIEAITRVFPHWFAPAYRAESAGDPLKLPYDHHSLLAAVAPRLLMVGSAEGDEWAGPPGERAALELARPAWKDPSRAGYHIRPGEHEIKPVDWKAYMDFAAAHGW